MVLDIEKSIIDAIYAILIADTDLNTALDGTPRIAHVWATEDTVFPYLVNRIELTRDVSDVYPFMRGRYLIDVWSDSTNGNEALVIRKAIMNALDERQFATTEVSRFRLTYFSDGWVLGNEQNIWHRAMIFDLWLFRDAEITAIDAR